MREFFFNFMVVNTDKCVYLYFSFILKNLKPYNSHLS